MISLVLAAAFWCGVERSEVKHLTDPLAAKVDFTVIDTTIEALAALPLAHPVLGHEPRGIRPEEFHVYRVEGVVTVAKREQDQDIHLALRGDGGGTMIVELVDPRCATGSPMLEAARMDLTRVLAGRRLRWLMGRRVSVTGVGFYDQCHNQAGRALNCVELHPALAISMSGKS